MAIAVSRWCESPQSKTWVTLSPPVRLGESGDEPRPPGEVAVRRHRVEQPGATDHFDGLSRRGVVVPDGQQAAAPEPAARMVDDRCG